MVYVGFSGENGNTLIASGITIGGVALTKARDGNTGAGSRQYSSLWYILEASLPAVGARSVVITLTGSVEATSRLFATVGEVQGIAQTAPVQTDYDFALAVTTVSNQYTALTSTQWAFSAGSSGADMTFTHSNSQVEVSDQFSGGAAAYLCQLRGGAGQTALSVTSSISANRLDRVTAVWNEASGGAVVPNSMFFGMNF
jgi:hypothetical protein